MPKTYIRTGGVGRQGKSLRETFNYYVKRVNERMLKEYAFEYAEIGSMADIPVNTFKYTNYDYIMEHGITRIEGQTKVRGHYVGGKTVRYYGEEAIKIQIQSLARRASKTYMTESFIETYLNELQKIGMSEDRIQELNRMFHQVSTDTITLLIRRGDLPDMYFIYDNESEVDNIYNQIKNALSMNKGGIAREYQKETAQLRKQANRLIKSGFLKLS